MTLRSSTACHILLLSALREVGAGPVDAVEIEGGISPARDKALEEGGEEASEALGVLLKFDDEIDFDLIDPDAQETDDASASQTIGSTESELSHDPEKLLDRLFNRGVLPRYAFPTDVVTFHVFDSATSTERRPRSATPPNWGLTKPCRHMPRGGRSGSTASATTRSRFGHPSTAEIAGGNGLP